MASWQTWHMNAARTARERARAELTCEIKAAARRHLAAEGASRLSVRAIARELGMVSSALYRYFPSRDDLLTALIIDAYDALGTAAETADRSAPPADTRLRWQATCTAVRTWALEHPHEYSLIYGSPVPGYEAPPDTAAPASRVGLVLVGIVQDAWRTGALDRLEDGPIPDPELTAQLENLAARITVSVPAPVLNRCLIAWTQLFGMISFELFGQLVGGVDPSENFFAHTVESMADFLGIRPARPAPRPQPAQDVQDTQPVQDSSPARS